MCEKAEVVTDLLSVFALRLFQGVIFFQSRLFSIVSSFRINCPSVPRNISIVIITCSWVK